MYLTPGYFFATFGFPTAVLVFGGFQIFFGFAPFFVFVFLFF